LIRRVACLATLPGDITDSQYAERIYHLFDSARIYNKEHHIAGVFLVHHNTLLQVLEGESGEIARCLYHLGRNPNVLAVSVILNRETRQPLFANRWTIKLLNEGHGAHAGFLENLKKVLGAELPVLLEQDRVRLAEFFATPVVAAVEAKPPEAVTDPCERYRQMMLSMKAWPRPTQLRLTADLIKLCPRLIGRKVRYQRLLELNLFGSEEKLVEQLHLLDGVRALELSPGPREVVAPPSQSRVASSPVSVSPGSLFSQALRKFIHARSDRGLH